MIAPETEGALPSQGKLNAKLTEQYAFDDLDFDDLRRRSNEDVYCVIQLTKFRKPCTYVETTVDAWYDRLLNFQTRMEMHPEFCLRHFHLHHPSLTGLSVSVAYFVNRGPPISTTESPISTPTLCRKVVDVGI